MECKDFDHAITTLEDLYVKIPNEIFARHLLATQQQRPGELFDEFLRELCKLSKDCNLKAVSAEQHCEELIRDAFISGIASSLILAATYTAIKKCFFCGPYHVQNCCLAHEATSNKCAKNGHFARVCKSRTPSGSMATVFSFHVLVTITNIPQGLLQAAT
ncbi:uncharacterized protein [Panulirus ornatus]|uniref:uncharacterized protein n=1 Tax=Panulirus ornatus TaxID=150431 RepID=UPI003A87EF9F